LGVGWFGLFLMGCGTYSIRNLTFQHTCSIRA
jgi:hypothetical protein